MSANTTACIAYTTDRLALVRDRSSSTLAVWIADGVVDPPCSAIRALRAGLETRGFDDFDIWSGGRGGFRVRVTTHCASPFGLRQKAMDVGRLVRTHFGLVISINQLPSHAAVERVLA